MPVSKPPLSHSSVSMRPNINNINSTIWTIVMCHAGCLGVTFDYLWWFYLTFGLFG